ncbi:thioredoxin reductase [Chimaeribacter californicus]|uniref:Thioredoxin reductase n=1 Tax=Chimaeribacter californicus TaxID=2060067 RepID=A0A2N5EE15_9GAMM|nr:thioredoxin reductase [Chimaeribacter californicus]PLR40754.1 thioredoxin reductase [Chimaeribacter californicus]
MNLKFECRDVRVRPGVRLGEFKVEAADVALYGQSDDREILSQLDITEVVEWLAGQGYSVTAPQEHAA